MKFISEPKLYSSYRETNDEFLNNFLDDTIKIKLVNEFNKYIEHTRECPWWNNERATIGFYINGLVRETENTTLQEFTCKKTTKSNRNGLENGRADLWFRYEKNNFILESKICFSNYNINEEWDIAYKFAEKALKQLKKYKTNNFLDKIDYELSMCFEVIRIPKESIGKPLNDLLKTWFYNGKNKNKLHYFYLIALRQDFFNIDKLGAEKEIQNGKNKYFFIDKFNDCDYCYPAVAVYGLIKRRNYK